ncbi:MAG: aldo/keto reductase [Planctomycetes bacterium]|nr:aldo/keto reductase [Planctomycetota bacterium]
MSADGISRRKFVRDSTMVTAGLAAGLGAVGKTLAADSAAIKQTRSYNPNMEYRRLGKTDMWVSAVCMGGHWKRIDKMVPGVFKGRGWLSADLDSDGFRKNRREVIGRCLDVGINLIDACTREEVMAYSEALRGRRDKMFFAFSWYQEEMRNKKFRTATALLQTLDKGMKQAKLEYIDLWRIVMLERSGQHTEGEVEEMIKALDTARKQGKVRFTGCSTHDRPHIKKMIETYPDVIQVVVTPYTASSKELPKDSLFEAARKHDVGLLGIKPFASASLFKGDSSPDSPHAEEDNKRARMAVRYILCNPAIAAPIPGLINAQQVDNMAKAVRERRKLDRTEAKQLEAAMDEAWAKLPADYEWLKDWKYV